MKTTFWTRNLCIGVLMGLVLALGLQGTADAVSKPTFKQSVTDIAKFRTLNETFSISVSFSFDDLTSTTEAVTITFTDGITPIGQLYDITLASRIGTLTEEGGRLAVDADPDATPPVKAVKAANGSKFTFSKTEGTGEVSRKFTIQGRFTTAGRKTVVIGGTDSAGDDAGAWTITYIYHVTPANGASTDTVSLAGLTDGYEVGDYGDADQDIYAGSDNLPVLFTPRSRLVMGHTDFGDKRIAVPSGPISGVFDVYLKRNTTTDMVTATVRGSNSSTVGVYIYGDPTLEVDGLTKSEKGGMDNPGKPGEVIRNAFTATVKDGRGSGVPGVIVKFGVTAGGGGLIFSSRNSGTLVTSGNALVRDSNNQIITAGERDPQYVRTTTSGKASVDFRLGSIGTQSVTVSVVDTADATFRSLTEDIEAFAGSRAGKQLSVFKIVSVPDSPDTFDLFASVTNNGEKLTVGSGADLDPATPLGENAYDIVFRTDDGTLTNTPDSDTSPLTTEAALPEVKERPNEDSIAVVRFKWDGTSSNPQVTASFKETVGGVSRFTQTITFNVTGRSNTGDDDDDPPPPTITRNLNINVSGSGSTRTVTVTALLNGVSQTGTSVALTVSGAATLSDDEGPTPFTSTLTLPTTAGTYTLRASTTAPGYSTVTEAVEVTVLGTLTISTISPTTGAQTVSVTARKGGTLQGGVNFTISGGGIVPARGVTTATGSGNAILNFPRIGTYALTVRADGYIDLPVSVTVSTTGQQQQQQRQQQQQQQQQESEETVIEPASIKVSGPGSRSGTVNEALDAPLLAQVLDADGDGVGDARVIFRVREGRGRLSQRGNGRAIAVQTDSQGFARADFTPLSDGTITVEAEVRGITRKASFTITTGGTATTGTTRVDTYTVDDSISALASGFPSELSGASFQSRGGQRIFTFTNKGKIVQGGITYTCTSVDGCTIQGQRVTKGTIEATKPGTTLPSTGTRTPSTTVSPVLNASVDAASRPPMLWVSGGQIYALVGSEVKVFIAGVENAMNLAVGGGKVYWTAKTSDTHGTLNAANLDGTGAKELRSLWGVPRGIAVDVAGSKLYWTDAANRLQRADLDGSDIQNVIRNLSDPMDLVLAGGNAYWIGNGSGTDTLSFITLTDPKKVIHPIATTLGTYGGLAIAGGKVYWTEKTSDTHGTLHSANLDGTGAKELRTDPIWGAPVGIAVDTARSRLYWTDATGRLQRSNLDASGIHNVVKGLGLPGNLVLSNSIQAPTGTATTTGSGKGKYDVNGDGKVDVKDSDMLLLAVTAGITDAKYDVNGDGKVDINDIVDVTANRDNGAASAPALLGTKFTAVERDRLQEQINLLIATGDRSPAALKTLVYLQQLIAMARPEKTQLLANYPNPFNPETWIPYELATDTDVRITIYNAQGVVIRTLQLGQQSAGYYTDRERAAYWDGRNALGEQVASGVYFYQFETDEMSSMRKMVILK